MVENPTEAALLRLHLGFNGRYHGTSVASQCNGMAESEGFEPPIALRRCLISSQVHSTGLCQLSYLYKLTPKKPERKARLPAELNHSLHNIEDLSTCPQTCNECCLSLYVRRNIAHRRAFCSSGERAGTGLTSFVTYWKLI
jgi:hypothetical protein